MVVVLLAALTVTSPPELGCADRTVIVERLRAIGVADPDAEDVRVRFFAEGEKRVAEIGAGASAPRRIEHAGTDCGALTDATVALLSVLLDEIAEGARREARPPPPSPPPPPAEPNHAFRIEAGGVVSNGIVADVGLGPMLGVAWRPARWVNLGVIGELWPARDHALLEGNVRLSAWTAGLALCVGPRFSGVTLEGCAIGHGGLYSLSAEGFPVVRPVDRGIFGGELALRLGVPIAGPIGLFVRAGMWVPVTRLDVTVRGAAEGGFSTTAIGPKAALGLELNP